jgi:hypothetical protein
MARLPGIIIPMVSLSAGDRADRVTRRRCYAKALRLS